jgi:hypothetical protein
MADYWYAECIPCAWSTQHTDQDAAIKAAEDHVFSTHRDVPSTVRGTLFMGHVINRTENAFAVPQPSTQAEVGAAGSEAVGSLELTPQPAQPQSDSTNTTFAWQPESKVQE